MRAVFDSFLVQKIWILRELNSTENVRINAVKADSLKV